MNSQNQRYPEYLKHKAPRIHLPVKKNYDLIYSYFNINNDVVFNRDSDPRKIAECKVCNDKIRIMPGSSLKSSYTIILTHHLRRHSKEYENYLIDYSLLMVPDTKSVHEHFDIMDRPFPVNRELADRQFEEYQRNSSLEEKNLAGISYAERDFYYYIERNNTLIESQNAKMMGFIHNYSNQNLSKLELMGHNHPSANLLKHYKKSRSLVDNDHEIVTDLQRLFCKNMCFFDPELHGNCIFEYQHDGDIAIFSDVDYLYDHEGFKEEIEKYPEMQFNLGFDHQLLKRVKQIEKFRNSLLEMHRMLTIITSLIAVTKNKIKTKIDDIMLNQMTNGLLKPELAIHRWGPIINDMDVSEEDDETSTYPEKKFSTFIHVDKRDCPAFYDESKKKYSEPISKEGKVYYPCDVGGCITLCKCPSCTNPQKTLACPDHAPDHPELFKKGRDTMITRRVLFAVDTKIPIFSRPFHHPKLCPPPLKLSNIRQQCEICVQNVKDHLKHHFTLHTENCEICKHIDFISHNSYGLICHVCLKKFNRKDKLNEHVRKHSSSDAISCHICKSKFSNRFNMKRHLSEFHKDGIEVFRCKNCDKYFSNQRNLNRHLKDEHRDEEQFKCSLCEKTYNRKDTLNRHVRITHNVNEKKAVIPGTSDRNKSLHNCSLCESIFTQKSDIERHMQTVHASSNIKKIYECSICKQTFNRKDSLRHHNKKFHSKPITKIICEVCRNQFDTKDDLRAHRLSVHENN